MILHLRYYLHRLLPGVFKKPQVLLSKQKIVQHSAVVSTVYTLFFDTYQDADYFFRQLETAGIHTQRYEYERSEYEYLPLKQSFLVSGQLDSKFFEYAPQITLDEQVISDELSVTEAILVDWSPR